MVDKLQPIDNFKDILKEGWLAKESRFFKSWRKRWFVLTPSHLFSFKEERIYKNPTEAINLKECTTVKSAEEDIHKENSFRIDSAAQTFYIQASSTSEKESWIGAIGKAMVRPSIPFEDDD
mmetsp:Transcript_18330/g.21121  ORF Transcript_18330/g.21121 Transcript_18330/m.21121 type:complete len:121 (+) Transcript_18330:23-385(+)|eukprot:CAMPEP_0176447680 /NCGR_PEP_ID=MMETSP0127-20121128/25213_1 /TAXON_ID=938130 /ORGANISM="Platyophrya macrostoma, Strain WH" /LENGTH=120 /DNA_ID=CAMNT_0017834247 /DNA_START=23 /DNA_END=385 /DNA_ORIENTATION=+